MTCRAGLRGFLRGLTLILRGGTSFGESAALVVYYYNPKSALFCLPVATARHDLRITLWRMLVLLGLLPLMPPVPKRPPVARERVIPRTPAGPPWKLISQRASAMSSKIARRSKLSERRWSSTCSTSITCSGSRKATPHSRCTSTIDWQPHHLFLFLKRHGGDGELVGVLGGPGTGRSKAESAKWPRASVARADGKNVRMHFVLF